VARATALAAAVGAAAALAAGPAVASAGSGPAWNHAAVVVRPQSESVIGPQLAFANDGTAAAAFSLQNEQTPGQSTAYAALGTSAGRWTNSKVSGAQLVLGMAFGSSRTPWLLTGTAPSPRACCATVSVRHGAGGSARKLVTGLTGITDGQLVALTGGQLLAAIATQRGVWIGQSSASGALPSGMHQLRFKGAPAGLDATAMRGGGGAVAWSDAGSSGETEPQRILYATGSARTAPSHARSAVSLPSGDGIDELALEPAASGATVAWLESSFDSSGGLHSTVEMRDLKGGPTRTVSAFGVLASDISFAADAAGDQVLAWNACSSTGTCSVQAAVRRSGGRFGAVQTLGPSDPIEAPAAAMSRSGKALVAWIRGGDVVASSRPAGAGRFGGARTASSAGDDYGVAVGFTPRGNALAAWTEGTGSASLDTAWNNSP
jgi:hypothetical protein